MLVPISNLAISRAVERNLTVFTNCSAWILTGCTHLKDPLFIFTRKFISHIPCRVLHIWILVLKQQLSHTSASFQRTVMKGCVRCFFWIHYVFMLSQNSICCLLLCIHLRSIFNKKPHYLVIPIRPCTFLHNRPMKYVMIIHIRLRLDKPFSNIIMSLSTSKTQSSFSLLVS